MLSLVMVCFQALVYMTIYECIGQIRIVRVAFELWPESRLISENFYNVIFGI